MRVELLLLFLVVEVGIYLMRLLPLLPWSLRREAGASSGRRRAGRSAAPRGAVRRRGAAGGVGPPEGSGPGNGAELARNAGALVPTFVVAHRFGNLGLTVLVGVLAHGLVSLVT